jgi:hypothetical protein
MSCNTTKCVATLDLGVAPAGCNAIYGCRQGAGQSVRILCRVFTAELRRLLGGADAPKGPPKPVPMPSKNALQKADGSFMTYEEYERTRKWFHSPDLKNATVWPALPQALYEKLIDFYSGSDMNLRPLIQPPDYGDFPLPSGDTGTA